MQTIILIIFALTYLGVALGSLPGLALDRTGFALLGAIAMVASGWMTTGAQFYSDDAICWPPEEGDRLPPVKGLLFGDPNGLTRAEKNQNAKILRRYAHANRVRLGFDPTLAVDVPSFHPTFRVGSDGRLHINMVAELVQTRPAELVRGVKKFGTFPLRGGATVIISKPLPDAPRGAAQPVIRYVIAKQLHGTQGHQREERQRLYYQSQGFLAGPPDDPQRFQLNYARIHGGC